MQKNLQSYEKNYPIPSTYNISGYDNCSSIPPLMDDLLENIQYEKIRNNYMENNLNEEIKNAGFKIKNNVCEIDISNIDFPDESTEIEINKIINDLNNYADNSNIHYFIKNKTLDCNIEKLKQKYKIFNFIR